MELAVRIEMLTKRGTFAVLNIINGIVMIIGVFLMAGLSYYVRRYTLDSPSLYPLPVGFSWFIGTIICVCFPWIILVMISFILLLGRKKDLQKQPWMLKCYAALMLACLTLQIIMQIYFCTQASTTIGQILEQDYITKFETLSNYQKEFIQKSQQDNHCCGMLEGWKNYGKSPKEVPDSCCGRYSNQPVDPSSSGHCTQFELEKTPGCNDQIYQIILTTVSTGVSVFLGLAAVSFIAFLNGFQLLFSILVVIQYRRLLEQSDSISQQNLEDGSMSEEHLESDSRNQRGVEETSEDVHQSIVSDLWYLFHLIIRTLRSK